MSQKVMNQKALKEKVSDASIRERTGRGWQEWFGLLDKWGATKHKHGEIVRWLMEERKVDGWSAQSVAVAYEQERGIRSPGQQSDGTYAASGTKTVAAPIARVFEAFTDAKVRRRWLPGKFKIRTSTAPKSLRADWEGGETRLAVSFEDKGDGKTQVALLHEKLPDAQTVSEMKAFWRERLALLAKVLD